jgi:hypothetical protein
MVAPRSDSSSVAAVIEAAGAAQEIAEEHAILRQSLTRLRRLTDLPVLVRELADLRALLAAHFAREEAPQGLHDAVGCAAHLLPRLDALFADHKVLLAEADALLTRATACLDGPLAEVRDGVILLAHHLRQHEQEEEEALAESVYVDLGRC